MSATPKNRLKPLLSSKRIFLTGATGTFGKWLIHELRNMGCEMAVLTRDAVRSMATLGILSEHITFIEGDIRDFSYPEGHFDYIIHAATPVVSDVLSDTELREVIVAGTMRVLAFSKHVDCQRMLYVSSGGVYGQQPAELDRIPESFPCNPTTVYGKSKLVAEDLCLRSGIDCVIARCFAFVGPGMPINAHFAIGNFINSCLKHEPIVIRGDGTPLRSYMYSADLAQWLLTLLSKGSSGTVYNVGSDLAICIKDLAHLVREIAGANNQIEVLGKVDPSTLPERYVPCIRRASRDLGLSALTGLRESIKMTLAWYSESGRRPV